MFLLCVDYNFQNLLGGLPTGSRLHQNLKVSKRHFNILAATSELSWQYFGELCVYCGEATIKRTGNTRNILMFVSEHGFTIYSKLATHFIHDGCLV